MERQKIRSIRSLPVVLVGLTMFAASCGSPNSLEGTIGKRFSLEFDRVEALKSACLVQIDYIKVRPLGTSIPCRLIIDTQGLEIVLGEPIDGNDFLDAADISRVALSGGAFPATQRGSVRFESLGLEAGEAVKGEFEARFEKEDLEVEYDLSGRFNAILSEPDPDLTCD